MELDSLITGAETTATLEIEHSFTLQTGYKIKMVVSGDMGFSTTSTTSNCVVVSFLLSNLKSETSGSISASACSVTA